jgi:hypothetical protein
MLKEYLPPSAKARTRTSHRHQVRASSDHTATIFGTHQPIVGERNRQSVPDLRPQQSGRGYRLGDLHRLTPQYGRAASEVFPVGRWHKGGSYGSDVNFPVPQAEQNNPNIPAARRPASIEMHS